MPTVAEQLRQGRERSGLTLAQISETTKIKSDHLRALEESNYDAFVAPVYIKGFVRNYSNLLKLETPRVLAQLDEELSKTERFKENPRLTKESRSVVDLFMLQLSRVNWAVTLPLILLALILCGAAIGYRIWKEQQTRDPLKGLSSGLYHPAAQMRQSGETLPIPTRTNLPTR